MLSDSRVSAVLPVVDLERARNFMKKSLDFGLVMLLEELSLNVDMVHSWFCMTGIHQPKLIILRWGGKLTMLKRL